jgi:hypothetical protein
VVFDVRGNGGGDSAWGDEIASAFWGAALVAQVKSKMDDSTDWRISASNLAMVEFNLKRSQAAGLGDAIGEWTGIRHATLAGMTSSRGAGGAPSISTYPWALTTVGKATAPNMQCEKLSSQKILPAR